MFAHHIHIINDMIQRCGWTHTHGHGIARSNTAPAIYARTRQKQQKARKFGVNQSGRSPAVASVDS